MKCLTRFVIGFRRPDSPAIEGEDEGGATDKSRSLHLSSATSLSNIFLNGSEWTWMFHTENVEVAPATYTSILCIADAEQQLPTPSLQPRLHRLFVDNVVM